VTDNETDHVATGQGTTPSSATRPQALGGDHTVGVRGSSRGVRTSSGGPGMERIVGIATEHRIEIQALPSA